MKDFLERELLQSFLMVKILSLLLTCLMKKLPILVQKKIARSVLLISCFLNVLIIVSLEKLHNCASAFILFW
jgi:hypothetical protein